MKKTGTLRGRAVASTSAIAATVSVWSQPTLYVGSVNAFVMSITTTAGFAPNPIRLPSPRSA